MPISWNEIKTRSLAFSKEWENEKSEDAEAKSFWDGFFDIFGISRRRVASFEEPVKKLGNKQGFIDLFWKGVLIVEHKSRGKSLDKAYTQALDYFDGIKERDLPKYVLVSDFERFRLYDLDALPQQEIKQVYNSENNESPALPCNYHESCNYKEFELKDLHKYVKLFGFIAGYQTHKIEEQDPVNVKAAEQMGRLHDLMKDVGYDGHALELYLVRLLFCMFAEDTGIFERQQFQDYIEDRTNQDGSDLGDRINTIFQVLNTPEKKRFKNLDEQLAAFPYINGRLFEEIIPTASFDSSMRQTLLDCCALDWSKISPAIFGSLFQSIMDKTARRNLGAHYTSEKNILKVIKPLFLDSLWEEFKKIKSNKNKLIEFHDKLRTLTFLDPACGCGNFLVITYRELRLLELDVLRALFSKEKKKEIIIDRHPRLKELEEQTKNIKDQNLDIHIKSMIKLNVDQFYGIEIEEFPAQIAQVALWLMDHQMNLLVSEEFGLYFARIPLSSSSKIICGNALQIDWNEVIPAEKLSYIMGNPPFVGSKFMNASQRADVAQVFGNIKNAGLLDFVAAWYVKAARVIQGTSIRCAFVSTNSITQGEQVGVLWSWMLSQGIKIFFAHRTFQWNNEAKGKAAVHCVIIGFSTEDISPKWLFEYEDIKSEPHQIQVKNINPYLVDAPDIVLNSRQKPLCEVPLIGIGNQPIDGGNYLFTEEEKNEFLKKEPQAESHFRRWLGADEFLNGWHRYCLWLGDCSPSELKQMPEALKLVEAVKQFRLKSKRASTVKLANTPTRFLVENMPQKEFLIIPETSAERRNYIPLGFKTSKIFCSNAVRVATGVTLYHFGILTSLMHNAWMRTVCGRLKSDYRYSAGIVYNNFPWPENPTDKQKKAIEDEAQSLLDARSQFPESSLADLYDPLTMPPTLLKAHHKLDKAVDAAYGKTNFKTEAERVAFLFELYQTYLNELPLEKSKSKKAKKT
ncbi:MAG: class I SAM-dependent DNA methyltransferase [Desulfamplus sp.]|nr:class I SAM-dependent DNA methyltransferase [Desulfamplus sp.]